MHAHRHSSTRPSVVETATPVETAPVGAATPVGIADPADTAARAVLSTELVPAPLAPVAPTPAPVANGSSKRGTGPAVRCSDAEREKVARILNLAAGEGLLTLAEVDERLLQVYAARTRDDLAPLTADLPEQGRSLLENTPEARSAARAGVLRHGGSVAVIALLLIAVWFVGVVAQGELYYFWPAWPIGFMAFGVLNHSRRIRRHAPH